MFSKPKRIVFATIGSLGDLHPCLALGQELQSRGHSVTIAATKVYRDKVEDLGMSFCAMRPNWEPTDQELIRQCEVLRTGPEVLFRKLILPYLPATYRDLLSACAGIDLLIAGELVYAAPLVAERLQLRWISMILSPSSFFSSHDPSVLVTIPGLMRLRKLGRPIYWAGLQAGRIASWHWSNPVRNLRRQLGLRRNCDPVFRDKFSRNLVLALFSPEMAHAQPDWPEQTLQPGFVFHDNERSDVDASRELAQFLAKGDAPLVFTLGSTAAHHPGNFYEASVAAARELNCRAVLIGSKETGHISPDIFALPYVPYSKIFPSASVVVHQGGSGTTGQALRAGHPMLVIPYGWDQPDNGARMERLGLGLALARDSYSSRTAIAAIRRLLTDPSFAARTKEVGWKVRNENGLSKSGDAIESILSHADEGSQVSWAGFTGK